MTDFHPLRWLAFLLLSLLWATMGSTAALAERGEFSRCALAAKSEVILDANAVFRYKEAQGLLRAGETPVITQQTVRELNQLAAEGRMQIPGYVGQFKVVPDVVDIGTQAMVRRQVGGFSGSPTGPIVDLNTIQGLSGDGIIGTTGILTGRPIITADQALLNALSKMGASPRGL
jgi:hypothetical protein